MRYIIYVMTYPSHLKEIEQDGYYQKTVYRAVLERLDITGVEYEHSSMEGAIAEIHSKREKLKHLELTILPILQISYDGEIITL